MLNTITIMGRLTREPHFIITDYTRIPRCSFTLAVERDVKNKEGQKETDFIDVVAWRSTAEFIQKYFHKGQMAVVTGRLQISSMEIDGQKTKYADVVASSVYFGESKKADPQPQAAPAQTAAEAHGFADISAEDDGDLPF